MPKRRIIFWGSSIGLLFFGSLFWAHSRDPFHRIQFNLKTAKTGKVSGIAVLPRGYERVPVLIYAHGSGYHWLSDGNTLRECAELGLAAVSFDYDQTNDPAFDQQFSAVLDYIQRQPWAQTNAIAWIGASLGAQETAKYLLRHPQAQPQVYVRFAGGWGEEFKNAELKMPKTPVLLVQGENDDIFPVDEVRKLAGLLQSNGTPVTLKIVPEHAHGLADDHLVGIRLIAEYCKAKLTPDHPGPEFPRLHPYPFWLCVSPAFLWAGLGWHWKTRRRSPDARPGEKIRLTNFDIGLRVTAVVLATLAMGDSALHLVPPRMQVSERTLDLARRHLLASTWHPDFEILARQPIWQGQRLQTLLTHVELAHYTVNELINWKVEENLYNQYVLSPVIVGGEQELDWRRELWESLWPRVRHENTTEEAARIVVRFLRERVTIAPKYPKQPGVETSWEGHMMNLEDFDILYVAALRSVGVPARLGADKEAEFWTGDQWKTAPRPLAVTWVE